MERWFGEEWFGFSWGLTCQIKSVGEDSVNEINGKAFLNTLDSSLIFLHVPPTIISENVR